jgi:hypothetical protein
MSSELQSALTDLQAKLSQAQRHTARNQFDLAAKSLDELQLDAFHAMELARRADRERKAANSVAVRGIPL